jgi:methylglutamate dehydrogenase subunit C
MNTPSQRSIGGHLRLPSGGYIDRTRKQTFTFDTRLYTGFAGDTLASALVANGVRLVGRSFKYHRPRGILSAGSEEPNALVELRTGARREPNTRATTAELYDGLEAFSQNRWPSLEFDLLSVNGFAAPLLSAGFYYKTFMWPASFWEKVYEPLIRRAAGLGRAAHAEDPDHYEKAFAHCDVLVIGSGPAGLMAALTAGRTGARVILAEADFVLGGRLLSERYDIDGAPAAQWLTSVTAELRGMSNVRIMPRTTIYGVYDGGTYAAVESVNDHVAVPPAHEPRQRHWRIVAKRSILAAGAIERPLVFGNNDRPGIMLASAARTYVNRFAAAPGDRIAIFTASDDGWRTAYDAVAAGVYVVAVIDSRRQIDAALAAPIAKTETQIFVGGQVVSTSGGKSLGGIAVRAANGTTGNVDCDALFVSGGWSPVVNLTCHLGSKPVWNEGLSAFLPGTLPPGMIVAGAANGQFALYQCLTAGAEAGASAATGTGHAGVVRSIPHASDEPTGVTPLWFVKESRGPAFVDYQNDVTVKDITLAEQEGYRSVELLKRYTTLGMATDQGKTANVNGLALLAEARGAAIATIGTTVYRPPFTPVSFGALGGHHRGRDFRPARLTPAHAWAVEQGAVMRDVGAWVRAGWFPRAGEKDWLETTIREVKTTRSSVGLCDVSTLGKIDLQGPDAAAFLDRVYCNPFSTLAVGKARYGLMLRDDGFVMDDGTTSRLAPEHFLMTTTTANAGPVMQHLEFCHQCLWPELDVQMVSVSEQWAQYSVAGPRARDVLAKLVDRQHDISNAAVPYMAARELTVLGGTPARLFRISFSGELAYEIAVPARLGDAMARQIMKAGEAFGITPYGLEALTVMRIEKGHVAGGELNGQTTARDLGLGKMMSTKKDYIGRVLSQRPALLEADRWQLVGLKPVEREGRPRAGSHLIAAGKSPAIEHDQGYVTSTAYSPDLGQWIALGLLNGGTRRYGEKIRTVDPLRGNSDVEVEVCNPIFIDPEGQRLHG